MSFVEEAYAEIPEMERQQILADEKVKALLRAKTPNIGVKRYGDVELRFRKSIDKSMLRKLMVAKTELETNPDPENVMQVIYRILSELCIDPPWNRTRTWLVYDENVPKESISVMDIFLDIMKEVTNQSEDVKNFRRVP